MFPAVSMRASGGLQAGCPDKRAQHLRPAGPDTAQRHRNHHHDDQMAAQRHLRLTPDEEWLSIPQTRSMRALMRSSEFGRL